MHVVPAYFPSTKPFVSGFNRVYPVLPYVFSKRLIYMCCADSSVTIRATVSPLGHERRPIVSHAESERARARVRVRKTRRAASITVGISELLLYRKQAGFLHASSHSQFPCGLFRHSSELGRCVEVVLYTHPTWL